MKANEFRLGNLIQIVDQVHPITTTHLSMIEIGSSEHIFRPIPLTEEWLIKFGFKFIDYEIGDDFFAEGDGLLMRTFSKQIHDKVYFEICLISDGFNEFILKTPFTEVVLNHNLNYVHQLQNLYFALRREELEIKS